MQSFELPGALGHRPFGLLRLFLAAAKLLISDQDVWRGLKPMSRF